MNKYVAETRLNTVATFEKYAEVSKTVQHWQNKGTMSNSANPCFAVNAISIR